MSPPRAACYYLASSSRHARTHTWPWGIFIHSQPVTPVDSPSQEVVGFYLRVLLCLNHTKLSLIPISPRPLRIILSARCTPRGPLSLGRFSRRRRQRGERRGFCPCRRRAEDVTPVSAPGGSTEERSFSEHSSGFRGMASRWRISRGGASLEVRRRSNADSGRGGYATSGWVPLNPIFRARRALIPTPHAPCPDAALIRGPALPRRSFTYGLTLSTVRVGWP